MHVEHPRELTSGESFTLRAVVGGSRLPPPAQARLDAIDRILGFIDRCADPARRPRPFNIADGECYRIVASVHSMPAGDVAAYLQRKRDAYVAERERILNAVAR